MSRWSLFLSCALALSTACGDKEDAADDTAAADGGAAEDGGAEEETGESLYMTHCADCHGADAMGTDAGPGLEQEVARHSDEQLIRVILEGEHDMPAIDVTEEQAQMIVDYLRELFGA